MQLRRRQYRRRRTLCEIARLSTVPSALRSCGRPVGSQSNGLRCNGFRGRADERPASHLEIGATDEQHPPGPATAGSAAKRGLSGRSPTTACWPTATPPRWSTATGRSAGCACPATTARRCSPRSSIPTAGTGRSGRRTAYRSERRYLPGTLVIETTFTTESGQREAHRRDGVRRGPAPPRARARRAAPAAAPRSRAVVGEVELELELAPRPEYGLVKPLFRATEGGGRTFGGPNQIVVSAGVPTSIEDSTMSRDLHGRGRRAGRIRAAMGAAGGPGARAVRARPRSPRGSRTRSRLALVGGRARHLRGPAPRARAAQLARAQGPHLPARPARSSPRRPPRCPRRSAASATGTTATPGSATPA